MSSLENKIELKKKRRRNMTLFKNKGNFQKTIESFEKYQKTMVGCGKVQNLGVKGIYWVIINRWLDTHRREGGKKTTQKKLHTIKIYTTRIYIL